MSEAIKIQPYTTADEIQQRLIQMILEHGLVAGERLPPERRLAEEFGVSRPTLRTALQTLETRGYITRRQGGGTFVAEALGTPMPAQLVDLFKEIPQLQSDLLEFRHAMEELSCQTAALRANELDKEIIRRRFEEWLAIYHQNEKATAEEIEADLRFHLSIIEASHNLILPHFMKTAFKLLEYGVKLNLKHMDNRADYRQALEVQHRAMLDAILQGNAEAARQAVLEHLKAASNAALEATTNEERYRRSSARFSRLQ